MLASGDSILQFSQSNTDRNRFDTETFLIDRLGNAVALDYDYQDGCIYWSEFAAESSAFIRRICDPKRMWSKNNTSKMIETIHSITIHSPAGIAVDWIGRNLYWCDKGKDTIEVSRLDGKYRRVLIERNLEEPRSIVVNPLEGIMFWSDWGEHPYIGRANMDGTNVRTILNESLGWPNALTLDYIRRELYFADAREDYIGVVDFDGGHRKILYQTDPLPSTKSRFVRHIFSLSFFESRLYWTDWLSKLLVSCPVANCTTSQFLIHSITKHRPMEVQVYHQYRQPKLPNGSKSLCIENGPNSCQSLCLLRPKSMSESKSSSINVTSVCSCPIDYILNEDGISCKSNCTNFQFECRNTYICIPFWWKCGKSSVLYIVHFISFYFSFYYRYTRRLW